jgi:hypothetical protein
MAEEELHGLRPQCWDEQTTGRNFDVCGWYYTLYRDQWRRKRIIDSDFNWFDLLAVD